MAPLFSYVSTELFTGKGVQISCLGKTKKAGYFFVPLISPKLFQVDQVHSCSEMNENESTNSARYLMKRLRDPTSLIWQAQKVLLNSLNKVSLKKG